MKEVLIILQLGIAIALITSILMQARGTGLGNIFGGGSESYRSKRGVERILFLTTIGLAAGFLIVS
ncbi:preprotein translocase subunit SecG, partial [Candidatus Saccharibacteria bacterium]|nr:preprotein translocase subunit SecG [Candidatus Saccharibacteria bacterium]